MRSKQTEVFLLGSTLSQISSSGKLPVKGDVQRYLKGRITRNKRGVKPETLICCPLNSQTKVACCDDLDRGCQKSGDRCVVAELKQDSWLKSGYAIKDDHEITKMILRDYEKLKILVKHKSKTSQVAEEERKSFKLEMSKLLDIARYDAEDIIMKDKLRSKEAKEEDLSFLKDQRSERKGKVSVIDKKHQQAVSTQQIKVKAFEAAKEKADELKLVYEAKKLDDFNVGTEDTDDDTYKCEVMSSKKRKRSGKSDSGEDYVSVRLPRDLLSGKTLVTGKRYHIGNQALTSVMGTLLSQAKEVDSDAPVDMNQFKLSRGSTQRNVVKTMSANANNVKEVFKAKLSEIGKTLFLVFDGQSVKETSKRIKVTRKRLAICVDSPELEDPQVLAVVPLRSNSGEDQVEALWPELVEWGVLEQLAGGSCDTVGENTGWQNGVLSRLQKRLGRGLVWRCCRRHSLGRHMMKAAIVVMESHWFTKLLIFFYFFCTFY